MSEESLYSRLQRWKREYSLSLIEARLRAACDLMRAPIRRYYALETKNLKEFELAVDNLPEDAKERLMQCASTIAHAGYDLGTTIEIDSHDKFLTGNSVGYTRRIGETDDDA